MNVSPVLLFGMDGHGCKRTLERTYKNWYLVCARTMSFVRAASLMPIKVHLKPSLSSGSFARSYSL